MTEDRLGLPEAILLLGWGDRRGWNRSIEANRHPVVHTTRVAELRGHTANALTRTEPVDDPWDAALGSLVPAAGWRLLMRLVPHGHRLAARKRARALARGEASADVADAIAETNAETAQCWLPVSSRGPSSSGS